MIKKRETLVENITYMAMMAAINIVFSLIASFLPIISIFIMIILPLTSVIVILYCKEKYFIIYALATIGLCLAVTFYNLQNTIFYIIPSLITGLVFGLLIKYRVHAAWILILTSLLQVGITYATIPLINFLFSTDIILSFKTAFALQNSPLIDTIIPSFILLCALAQCIFSYIIIQSEIKKFDYTANDQQVSVIWFSIYSFIAFGLMVLFAFFVLSVAYIFLIIGIFFSLYLIIDLCSLKKPIWFVILGICLIITFFVFGATYPILKNHPSGLLLISVFFVLSDLICLCRRLLLKKHGAYTINEVEGNND